MLRNQRGEAVIAIVGLTVVFGLFIAYMTGHPLPWNISKPTPVATVAVTTPAPVTVTTNETPVVVETVPAATVTTVSTEATPS